jgi:FlaA1/EpsC-like NDP-sugar epimerase
MRILQISLDALLVSASLYGAFMLRFDGRLEETVHGSTYLHQLIWFLPLIVVLRLVANWICGVYRRLWRYTGLTEVMELGLSVLSVSTILYIARAVNLLAVDNSQLSFGIISIDFGLCFILLTGPRVLRRLQTEHNQRSHWRQPVRRRALLVGAGDAGQLVLRELSQRADLGVDVIGLLDDDQEKVKQRVGALTVFGTTNELSRLVEDLFTR